MQPLAYMPGTSASTLWDWLIFNTIISLYPKATIFEKLNVYLKGL